MLINKSKSHDKFRGIGGTEEGEEARPNLKITPRFQSNPHP